MAKAGWAQVARACVEELHGLRLTQYRHDKYRTNVVLAQVQGPICLASMGFATEAKNNKGLPHCLEHLCFMGSKEYPRGYLDLLAIRCACEGTNAFTSDDHTQYVLEVAGEVGLVEVLPVFLNHLLCPLLTDDAFTTEVFHINGKGEKQGVVYSEMLGREQSEFDLLWLKVRQALFGDNTPYSYEAGGKPKDIAELKNTEISAYHRDVYTTDNLSILISGQLNEDLVLETISRGLDQAVAQGASVTCKDKPFLHPLPTPPADREMRHRVVFPSEDTSVGTFVYAWTVPDLTGDFEAYAATEVIFRYLTSIASSPLTKAFVETTDPIATSVSGDICLTAIPYIYLEISGVPYDGAEGETAVVEEEEEGDEADDDAASAPTNLFEEGEMLGRVVAVLREVSRDMEVEGGAAHNEILSAVEKERISKTENFEDDPHETLSELLAPQLFLGEYPSWKGKHSLQDNVSVKAFESLQERPAGWWKRFFDERVLRPLEITLEGGSLGAVEVGSVPSEKLINDLEAQKKKEEREFVKKTPKATLRQLQERVDAAVENNKVTLAEERKAAFPKPPPSSSIPELPRVTTLSPPRDDQPLELFTLEVPTNFIDTRMLFDLSRVPADTRRYLAVFEDVLLESNMDGRDYQTVVKDMDKDLVSYSASIGQFSGFLAVHQRPHTFNINLCAEVHKAEAVPKWYRSILRTATFPEDKVVASIKKLSSEISESMRSGSVALEQVLLAAVHSPASQSVIVGALSQRNFLNRCLADVPGTIAKLNELRETLASADTPMSLVVSTRDKADGDRIAKAVMESEVAKRPPLLSAAKWGDGVQFSGRRWHCVVGVGGLDTAYVSVLTEVSVKPKTKEFWSLFMLCQCISISEGPLSLAIRGMGLAYGASVNFNTYEGSVQLDIWECTNVKKALCGAFDVIRRIDEEEEDDEDAVLSEFQIENVKGYLAYLFKNKRGTPSSTVDSSIMAILKGLPTTAMQAEDEQTIYSITRADLLEAYQKYVKPLMVFDKVTACVVCSPSECAGGQKGLAEGFGVDKTQVEVRKQLSALYSLVDSYVTTHKA